VRAQGAFVSDDEVIGLVEFLKVNGPPVYAAEVQAQIDRAARLMDLMEDKGIVGPENGSSPREILVDLDSL
jgi:S-DNA-T family DNA segregation ATPase FtsK/SpoIIIE